MSLLANHLQPPILSLFDSSSSQLSPLWHQVTDKDLADDSLITFVNDAAAESSGSEALVGRAKVAGQLSQSVLHIQSPTLKSTYIQAGYRFGHLGRTKQTGRPLGIQLPWMHLQLRKLGEHRHLAVELCVQDHRGNEGLIRMSTFQRSARLRIPDAGQDHQLPCLHIPLHLPDSASTSSLTPWREISVNVPQLLPLFQNSTLLSDDVDEERPAIGSRHSARVPTPSERAVINYVRVYGNCRLKTIWFSEMPRGGSDADEMQMFAAS